MNINIPDQSRTVLNTLLNLHSEDKVHARFWTHLIHIFSIPRPSTDWDGIPRIARLDMIRSYIKSVADEHGWIYQEDHVKNVSIANHQNPILCFQGHMDVVCSKNVTEMHDFDVDPIHVKLINDDDDDDDKLWIKSVKQTTLGADNGVAIAAALAVMELSSRLEAIFTVDEETSFAGASGIEEFMVKSQRILNSDSEEDGRVCIGCAGGVEREYHFTKQELVVSTMDQSTPLHDTLSASPHRTHEDRCVVSVKVSGLAGGHSGIDIDKQILNGAVVIRDLFTGLGILDNARNFFVKQIDFGGVSNVIPREGSFELDIPCDSLEIVTRFFENEINNLKRSTGEDINLEISTLKTVLGEPVMEGCAKRSNDCNGSLWSVGEIGDIMNASFVGVLSREEISRSPRTSVNFYFFGLDESGKLIAKFFFRSSSHQELIDYPKDLDNKFLARFSVDIKPPFNAFPPWEPQYDSPFTALVLESAVCDHPETYAVHAGLECGTLLQRLPQVKDCASIGPTILGAHSPDERLSVESSKNFLKWIVKIVGRLSSDL